MKTSSFVTSKSLEASEFACQEKSAEELARSSSDASKFSLGRIDDVVS
jgi:hypothetical protein